MHRWHSGYVIGTDPELAKPARAPLTSTELHQFIPDENLPSGAVNPADMYLLLTAVTILNSNDLLLTTDWQSNYCIF